MGKQTYDSIVQEYRGRILGSGHEYTKLVARVLKRLLPSSGLESEEWEIFVIDDPSQKNAFVIPGGKVFVFTGILPICGNEDGIAAVLSHEIAHNVAHHAAERMSGSFLVSIGVVVLSLLFDVSGQVGGLLLDLGFLRPNSRVQEVCYFSLFPFFFELLACFGGEGGEMGEIWCDCGCDM